MLPRGRGRGRGELILELFGGGNIPKMEQPRICVSVNESPSLPAPQIGRGRGKIVQRLMAMRLGTKAETFQEKDIKNEVSTPGSHERIVASVPSFANDSSLDQPSEKDVINEITTPGSSKRFDASVSHNFSNEPSLDQPTGGSRPKTEHPRTCISVSASETLSLPAPQIDTVCSSLPAPQIDTLCSSLPAPQIDTLCSSLPAPQIDTLCSSLPAPQIGRGRGKIVQRLKDMRLGTKAETFQEKDVKNEVSTPGSHERIVASVPSFANDPEKESKNEVSTPGGACARSIASDVPCFANKPSLYQPTEKESENEVSTPGDCARSVASVLCFANKPSLHQPKGPEEMLRWFNLTNTKAVNLEYLNRLLNEPVGDTETLIYNFSPAQRQIRRCSIELARIRVLLDCGSKIDILETLTTILNTNVQIPDGALEYEKEIIKCYVYWFNTIINQIRLKNEPSEQTKTFSTWANSYVKAAFHELFSTKGCHRALAGLLCVDIEDNPSIHNLELLFLKARILGKLRYLEQWPASRWQEEETLLLHVIRHLQPLSTKWAARAQVYLVEFSRLRGYRRFLEGRDTVVGYVGIDPKINQDYKRSSDLLRSLGTPLGELELVEAMVWRAEQLLRLPTNGDWDDLHIELAKESLRHANSRGADNAYSHRIMALSLEKAINKKNREKMAEQQRWGEKVDRNEDVEVKEKKKNALELLDAAVKKGSSMAQLDRAGMLYRMDRSRDMLPVLQGLPDAGLHMAAYLVLCKNNPREAQHHLQPFLQGLDMYPPLLVHYPVCTPLHEPINLAHVVNSVTGNSSFLQTRKEILEESIRLTTNKKLRPKTHLKKNKKQAYPKKN